MRRAPSRRAFVSVSRLLLPVACAMLVGCASSQNASKPRVNAGLNNFNDDGSPSATGGGIDPALRPSSQVDLATIFQENAEILPALESGNLDQGRDGAMVGTPGQAQANNVEIVEAPPSRAGTNNINQGIKTTGGRTDFEPTPQPAYAQKSLNQRYERIVAELSSILGKFTDSSDEPLESTAKLSIIEALAPGSTRHPRDVRALSPREIDILESWRDMHTRVGEGLSDDPSEALDQLTYAVTEAARRMDAWAPLAIQRVGLCTKVSGFGVYDELPGKRLLAGRTHPMIVYVELNNFTSSPSTGAKGKSGYKVELDEELQLFHEADGVLAWRQPIERIEDFSRNQRRDFFLAQLIELPSELTVGAYRLKVRVTDRATDAVTEAIVPIEIVADAALVRAQEED